MLDFLSEVFDKGGLFFIINTFFLAIIIAMIVERSIYFLGRGHINAKAFFEQIRRLLAANNVDRAKKLCEATDAPVARVARAGLNKVHKGEAAVASAMEEAITDVTPEIKARVPALWSMANITVLTGLLGTVAGLINTFGGMNTDDQVERSKILAHGIEEAMYNTAYGIGIAVLCMVAHLIISTAMKKVLGDLESFSMRLENLINEGKEA